MSDLDRELIQNNILSQLRALEERLQNLERYALTAGASSLVLDGLEVRGNVDVSGDVVVGDDVDVTDDVRYAGDLVGVRGGVDYAGYTFHPLTTPLTSTSWDGDGFSDIGKTLIDLSAVFGAPAGIRAVLVYVGVDDSGSAGADTYLVLSPNSTALEGQVISPYPVSSRPARGCLVVPCDANGDIYYQVEATGSGTFHIYMQIWGYWL